MIGESNTWGAVELHECPVLRAPKPDEHGGPIDSGVTVELLRKAKRANDGAEARVLRKLAKTTAELWNAEELNNLRERLLQDEELWDEIPALLE